MASVGSVNTNSSHQFSKQPAAQISLIEGHGVQGDAHFGQTVKHRSRVAQDPSQANLRQVHLIHQELLTDLKQRGFNVGPGDLGENVTTHGVDLLALPLDTVLKIGPDALIRLTGLRNPCYQIDDFQQGLLKQVLVREADGSVVRKTGVMAVVEKGGLVRSGDLIEILLPPGEKVPLAPV